MVDIQIQKSFIKQAKEFDKKIEELRTLIK